jgi:hypothetical protein
VSQGGTGPAVWGDLIRFGGIIISQWGISPACVEGEPKSPPVKSPERGERVDCGPLGLYNMAEVAWQSGSLASAESALLS